VSLGARTAGGRLLVLQFDEEVGPGLLPGWAATRGIALQVLRPGLGDALPLHPVADAVVVLGSEEAADDHDVPWIPRVHDWVGDTAAGGTPVLGLCFGAQVLARALGGAVARAARPEIGWIAVDSADRELVPPGPWFAWHWDVLTPPPGSLTLAQNATGVQAFAVGPHLGVQFHPEVSAGDVPLWLAGSLGEDLRKAGLDPARVRRDTAELGAAAVPSAWALFDGFAQRAGLPATRTTVTT